MQIHIEDRGSGEGRVQCKPTFKTGVPQGYVADVYDDNVHWV